MLPAWNVRSRGRKCSLRPGNARLQKWRAWKRRSHAFPPTFTIGLTIADITPRRRLRSSTSSELVIPLSWLVTVSDRSLVEADPGFWNTLPEDITSAPSLLVLRRKLKTHMYRQSYPDIIS